MNFKLQVGDVCRLTERIKGVYSSWDWKTGLYRVTSIGPGMGTHRTDLKNPRCQVYYFEKVKKDGTAYKNFSNGYTCLAWDKFIDAGKVEVV